MTDVHSLQSLHWPKCVRETCNYADTFCQGLCLERICQELKPWQVHLRWVHLLVILLLAKPLANVLLPRFSAFCQDFFPWQNTTFLIVVVWRAQLCVLQARTMRVIRCCLLPEFQFLHFWAFFTLFYFELAFGLNTKVLDKNLGFLMALVWLQNYF